MKKFFTTILMSCFVVAAFAQAWNPNGDNSTTGSVTAKEVNTDKLEASGAIKAQVGSFGSLSNTESSVLNVITASKAGDLVFNPDKGATQSFIRGWRTYDKGSALQFWTAPNNAEQTPELRMHIHHDGNVGIGTQTPTANLEVAGTIKSENFSSVEGSFGQFSTEDRTRLYLHSGSSGSDLVFNPNKGVTQSFVRGWNTYDGGSALQFWTAPNNAEQTPELRMHIHHDGNVGIGTQTPTANLEVAGTIKSENFSSVEGSFGQFSTEDRTRLYLHSGSSGSDLVFNPNKGVTQSFVRGWNTYDGGSALQFWTAPNNAEQTPELRMHIHHDGNVGIGTQTPTANLEVAGTIKSENFSSVEGSFGQFSTEDRTRLYLHSGSSGSDLVFNPNKGITQSFVRGWNTYDGGSALQFWTAPNDAELTPELRMHIHHDGNVGVGTQDPTAKLDVIGTIKAHEVIVEVSKGADFVFEQDYDLRSLSEVETFIKTNKHLPEVQSEKDMQQNGVNMNEFQVKLLQKIEELTLYVIQQDKRIAELESISQK